MAPNGDEWITTEGDYLIPPFRPATEELMFDFVFGDPGQTYTTGTLYDSNKRTTVKILGKKNTVNVKGYKRFVNVNCQVVHIKPYNEIYSMLIATVHKPERLDITRVRKVTATKRGVTVWVERI